MHLPGSKVFFAQEDELISAQVDVEQVLGGLCDLRVVRLHFLITWKEPRIPLGTPPLLGPAVQLSIESRF